jgi:hypothetical protein
MLDTLAAIWSGWWEKSADRQIAVTLSKAQVDRDKDYVELVDGQYYVRIWLAEMFLHDKVKIFQTWYPAVHSRVKLTFAGQPLELCNVADSTKVGMQQDHARGDVIARNFVLTPLLPLSGIIEMDAGLIAVEGQNYLSTFIKVLGDFSSLLAVPQLSSALSVAKPLATGLQALFGAGSLHLGLHDSITAGGTGGYYVAIRATENDVQQHQLWVVNNQLRVGSGPSEATSKPFTDFDYMLFRVEVRDERDDYDELEAIQRPMRDAQRALAENRDAEATAFYRAAILAAHQAPEFTRADKARVTIKLAEDFKQIKKDLGFSGLTGSDGKYSLTQALRHGALSPKAALDRGDPSLEELFSE